MNWHHVGLVAAAVGLLAVPVAAQNPYIPIPPAFSTELPPGISVRKTEIGDVYVDSKGRVLYGMDTGTLRVRTRTPNTFCSGPCAEKWEPVAAPSGTPEAPPAPTFGFGGGGGGGGQAQAQAAGAQAAQAAQLQGGGGGGAAARLAPPVGPDWHMTQGPNGPQLIYKRTHLVFVRKDDKPGSTKWDGEGVGLPDEPKVRLWNALRYIPPPPKLVAPSNVMPVFVDGGYAMADSAERVLYVMDKARKCADACKKLVPFKAGVVNQGIGDWTVSRDGDVAQWHYRDKPVFVSQGTPKSADIPAGATILRP